MDSSSNPIFTITETSYVECLWDISCHDMEVMALVYKDSPEKPWRATYRFRYYQDKKVFDSADRKSVYHLRAKSSDDADRDQLVKAMDMLAAMTRAAFPEARVERQPVRGGADVFMSLMLKRPSSHAVVSVPGPERPQ